MRTLPLGVEGLRGERGADSPPDPRLLLGVEERRELVPAGSPLGDSATRPLGEDRVDVWTGTQIPRFVQSNVAKIAGVDTEQVHVHVLMIGGSIPGQTKVASIAIYEEVEALNYAAANSYSLILFAVSFVILLLVYSLNGGYLKGLVK